MSVEASAPAYIRSISPYIPGKPIAELAREFGIDAQSIVKLASNENPLGMSPKARAAVRAAMDDLGRYPDGNGFGLKQALSRKLGVTADSLVLGNGSNDALELAARAFLPAGASAIYAQHAFAVYALAVQCVGARGIEVPARAWGHDLAAMADAISPDTRIVFIANPNNPTGTFIPGDLIEAFLARVPQDVVVVLDEAYNEYLAPADRADTVAWVRDFPNLVVVRTFSKIYGLAGLRVGYGVGSAEVVDLMNRVRQPFNVNNLALAGAIAALDDHEFLARSYESNRAGMEQIVAGLKRLGLAHIPSHGNFVTFEVADAPGVNQRLLKQGVIVRPIGGYGLPNHLRVTIGLEAENQAFLAALEAALRG